MVEGLGFIDGTRRELLHRLERVSDDALDWEAAPDAKQSASLSST
jgi:hypothetical protein